MRGSRPQTFRLRRRLALAVAVLALAGSVVLAHSAMASDHMGDALVVCVAVAETAGLGLLARRTTKVWPGAFGLRFPMSRDCGALGAAARPIVPPWARGSPVALQVLRL